MKHIGATLKSYIESNHLKKAEIAQNAGITYNYLSEIFKKEDISAKLLEKLCNACGLDPAEFFDATQLSGKYSDIKASAVIGSAKVSIGDYDGLCRLLNEKDKQLADKERTIKILMRQAGIND